jgi:hypothetical protein
VLKIIKLLSVFKGQHSVFNKESSLIAIKALVTFLSNNNSECIRINKMNPIDKMASTKKGLLDH